MNDVIKISEAFKVLRPTQSLGEGISSGFTSIGYRDQKWALKHDGSTKLFVQENGTLSPFLDVIIIAMNPNISKMYYAGNYVDGTNNAPICASLNGDKPDPGVQEPQHPICADCPHNEWGSGQGKGKACKDHRKLAVLLLPYMTKGILDKPLREPIYLAINPNSLKALKAYGDSLVYRNVHFASVITRITWSAKKQWLMDFTVLQALTDKEAPVVLPLIDSPLTKSIVGAKAGVYEEEEQELPAPQERKQPVDSGLLDAFGKTEAKSSESNTDNTITQLPLKRGPGRPRKVPIEPEQPAEEASGGDATPPWDEADTELSDAVAKLTSQKINKMLE
jgi:hypothetical protein